MAEVAGAAVDVGMPDAHDISDAALEQRPHALHHAQHHEPHPEQQLESQTEEHREQPSEGPRPENQQQAEATAPGPAASPSEASPPPAAFPKKRRGRPPGRPNNTVREADYEENPLVQAWNAARSERAVPVVTINIRAALTEGSLVHETQRAIFRLPSRETIHFVQGWITARHIASLRPSYVNGLLIHSRGQDAAVSCIQCTERRAKYALGPFLTCRVLPGAFHNSCSNCKWFDTTSSCSLYTGPKPNRKRKAKEQLPPPPPPANADNAYESNHNNPANPPVEDRQDNAPSETQLVPQKPELDTELQKQAQAQPPAQLQHQPEADMMPVQDEQQEQKSNETSTPEPTDNGQSAHSQPRTEPSGSEPADAQSQTGSVTESHFVLPKSDREEDTQEPEGTDDADDDDSDYVAAQLAAQLLPEIQEDSSVAV
ncbi:hypothetical protein VTK56DRAFT_4352 [Thermocarpiscus australiensis]